MSGLGEEGGRAKNTRRFRLIRRALCVFLLTAKSACAHVRTTCMASDNREGREGGRPRGWRKSSDSEWEMKKCCRYPTRSNRHGYEEGKVKRRKRMAGGEREGVVVTVVLLLRHGGGSKPLPGTARMCRLRERGVRGSDPVTDSETTVRQPLVLHSGPRHLLARSMPCSLSSLYLSFSFPPFLSYILVSPQFSSLF